MWPPQSSMIWRHSLNQVPVRRGYFSGAVVWASLVEPSMSATMSQHSACSMRIMVEAMTAFPAGVHGTEDLRGEFGPHRRCG